MEQNQKLATMDLEADELEKKLTELAAVQQETGRRIAQMEQDELRTAREREELNGRLDDARAAVAAKDAELQALAHRNAQLLDSASAAVGDGRKVSMWCLGGPLDARLLWGRGGI